MNERRTSLERESVQAEPQTSQECERVQAELGAYLDDEVGPSERAAIGHHLVSCAACRAEVALLGLVTHSLRQAPRPEPPEAMRQRLLAQVAAELPPHRVTVICTERHGDQVLQRREVRLMREPALLPPAAALAGPALGLIVQKYRQEAGYQANCYQLAASSTGRNHHE